MLDTQAKRYLVFGILAVVFNYLVFMSFVSLHVDFRIGNAITLVLTKVFIFFTNKFFVFKNESGAKSELTKEILLFIFARSFTGIVDFIGLILLVELFNLPLSIGKLMCIIFVTGLNYLLSKKIVFRR